MSVSDWGVFGWVAVVLYMSAATFMITYGLHMYLLTWLCRRRQDSHRQSQQVRRAWYVAERPDDRWPVVTTQIPLYNEANVARRVIEAVAAMDYPTGCHEIQVLDDSEDETRHIVDTAAADLRRLGHDVVIVRRPDRKGYKAGALSYGLALARGEVIAIFDADFVPPREFLRQGVPLLMDEPTNACLQGRWAHLNENHSWLTRAQSLGIDGHFVVEQGGRSWNDLFMSFNGTAGLWRRAAIEDPAVGGWSAETLTEDLDLSYRAQLAGWRIEYCMDLACPSELPETLPALKAQQYRWAKGSIQCARKLLPRIWRSGLPLARRLEATMHLTGYGISVAMLLLCLLSVPMSLLNPLGAFGGWGLVLAGLMWMSLIGPPMAHAYSRRLIRGRWGGMTSSPLLMTLGVGLCLNTSGACLSGLIRRGGEFVRTPKRGGAGAQGREQYRLSSSPVWLLELAAAVYSGFAFGYFVGASHAVVGGIMAIFMLGFGIVGWQSRPTAGAEPRRRVREPVGASATVTSTSPSAAHE
jgi:cellulose synthase/poly-beta-1,6-N-acetylglucosamine synthase-like glycosyltransferase